jgi:two-component system cell cycle response regulator
MKVLIAEDDKDSRELLSWLLQKLGYQVIATENGKEAWEAFRKGRFRIVISDVLMPEIDGLELCRRIRAHKQSKYTYIIVITALIGKKDYLEGMDAGADDFVTKPFDADELKARLRVAERILAFQEQAVAAEQQRASVQSDR